MPKHTKETFVIHRIEFSEEEFNILGELLYEHNMVSSPEYLLLSDQRKLNALGVLNVLFNWRPTPKK